MREVKPDYYEQFSCIADLCSMTCCQEWKIAVDDATAHKWKQLAPPDGMKTRKKNLKAFTTYWENGCVIALDGEHRCPFLNEQALCRLVSQYGDAVLSETCQIFPREVEQFESRCEYSLMSCCPEAVDLLNRADTFTLLEKETAEPDRENVNYAGDGKTELAYFQIRDFFMEQMLAERPVEQSLLMIFYMALDMQKSMGDDTSAFVLADGFQLFRKKERIAQLEEALTDFHIDEKETFFERNELLLDLAVNYQKEGLYAPYLDKILDYAERISEGEMPDWNKIEQIRQKIREYRSLFKKFLASEIYAGCYLPGGSLSDMLVKLEWIAMSYSAICQSILLYGMLYGTVSYETVRNYLVVISRMTGYDEEDIYEYLDNSFEKRIWEFGYFALITGTGE